MAEARVVVRTGVGLHARPAAQLVREAARLGCQVTIEYGGKTASARSILQVLALGVSDGAEILVRTEGDGAGEALDQLLNLLASLRG